MNNCSSEDLTDDQKEFIIQCEIDFSNRYTKNDFDYSIIDQLGFSAPPILEPWMPNDHNNRQQNFQQQDTPNQSRKRRYDDD